MSLMVFMLERWVQERRMHGTGWSSEDNLEHTLKGACIWHVRDLWEYYQTLEAN